MSYRLVRSLVAKSLGQWLPMPLRDWLMALYGQIDFIEDYRDFRIWLAMLDKLPAIYRRTGVPYKLAEHWTQAVKETPMTFFDAATVEEKDWSNIFIKVDNKNEQPYKDFWEWTGGNDYQVRIWLAEVVRKFFNNVMAEHNQMLEQQRNPKLQGGEPPPPGEETTGPHPDYDDADSWAETEKLERKLLERERGQGGRG